MVTVLSKTGAQVIVDRLLCEGVSFAFGLCGHGNFDLSAYDAYLSGKLEDPEFSDSDMQAALAALPEAPALA